VKVLGQGDEKEIEVVATKSTITKVSIKDNQVTELLPPGWEIIIRNSRNKIYVYGKNLESIEKITNGNYSAVTAKVNSHLLPSLGRKSIKARLILRNGAIENADIQIKHPGDFIAATPGIGFGFVADAFYPALNLSVGAIFRDRYGRKNHMIKLTTDYMLFTRKRLDGNLTVGTNLGTSLSYAKNFSKNSPNSLWVAFGVGIVSNRYGNNVNDTYFRGGTMRIFASFDLRNNFSIVPEMFLTDNVTNMIYGLRLNYTLP
jgi:hypothetical protein